jgi:hypothetical protein
VIGCIIEEDFAGDRIDCDIVLLKKLPLIPLTGR